MISWIVASNQPAVLKENLLATLNPDDGDEVIVIPDPKSITQAYAQGQAKATCPIRCYVHSDVEVLDPHRLRTELEVCHRADVGIVGVIGSRDRRMPWWDGQCLGSVVDGRGSFGVLDFGPGGPCSMVDGLLLATAQTIDWDESWPGFHGYDHDSCAQMLARGLTNWCLTGGHELVRHNTSGTRDPTRLGGWDDSIKRYEAKWG